jgi:hypothetical protein
LFPPFNSLFLPFRPARSRLPALVCAHSINSRLHVDAITDALTPTNARALLGRSYDVLLDCTDNPATRYLISDTAVLLGKPLVSGAAQRFDGQLCTYNLGPEGPCYRCLFPRPPSSPEAAPSCEETGILGPVTGAIGSLQALEAIRIIVGLHGTSLHPPPPSPGWRRPRWEVKKFGIKKANVLFLVFFFRQTSSRPYWSTPRWAYRRSGASSFGNAVLRAQHVVPKVIKRWEGLRKSTMCSSAGAQGRIGKLWV